MLKFNLMLQGMDSTMLMMLTGTIMCVHLHRAN